MPGHSELVTRADKSLCTYQKAFGYLYIKTVHVDQKKLLLFKNINHYNICMIKQVTGISCRECSFNQGTLDYSSRGESWDPPL